MRRALIVDDYEENLLLLRHHLSSHGFAVVMAHNGQEALELARSELPDIVISDILMPVMDGFSFCSEWQDDEALRSVPFVFYSATYTEKEDQELAMSLGAARFILKPTAPAEFIGILEAVITEFENGILPVRHRSGDANGQLRLYNAALIRKLEKKMFQLESAHQELAAEMEERRRMEAQVQLHARVFEEAHEGIVLLDQQLNVLSVNRALTELAGYAKGELRGQQPFFFHSGPHEDPYFKEIVTSVNELGHWQGEIWICHKDQSTHPVWMKASILSTEGGVTYILMLLDLSEQKTQAARIERLAFYDHLTGLPNRALLLDRLEQMLQDAQRQRHSLAVFFFNLEGFREINESQGHAAGDLVLQQVTRRFLGVLPDGGLLARTSSDEFIAVLADTDQPAAHFMGSRWIDSLREPIQIGETRQTVRARVGIAMFPSDGATADELIRNADIAMHRTRESRQNWLFFQPRMSQEAADRIQLESRLLEAIARDYLQLYYQPQVQLSSGKLIGVEALVRWQDKDGVWISPAQFIPLAEARGLIGALGQWVFEEACRQAREWRQAGLRLPARISINISAHQLTPEITEELCSICKAQDVPAHLFELELTETAAMADPEQSASLLADLRESGFSLAIDDFGVAHSSLVYLKRFSADKLKIDMSFVRGLLSNPSDRAIVETIISMARSLGMATLAEGVEEAAQSHMLLSMHCDAAQGYFFARPQTPADLARDWLTA